MSGHIRKQLRDAVVTELKKITAFGSRVYPYRTRKSLTLPDVVVFTPDETILPEYSTWGSSGVLIETREVNLIVAIRAKVADDIDDILDSYCVSVEKGMMTDESFSNLLIDLRLEKTEITLSGEAEQSVGMALLTYKAQYRAARNNPETTA
jgi:hypothetical protein